MVEFVVDCLYYVVDVVCEIFECWFELEVCDDVFECDCEFVGVWIVCVVGWFCGWFVVF